LTLKLVELESGAANAFQKWKELVPHRIFGVGHWKVEDME